MKFFLKNANQRYQADLNFSEKPFGHNFVKLDPSFDYRAIDSAWCHLDRYERWSFELSKNS